MKKSAGVWIDHHKAVVVSVSDEGQTVTAVKSGVQKQHGRIGSVHAAMPDDRRLSVLTSHMNGYYDKVVAALGDAKQVFLFGPGEAKAELKARIQKRALKKTIVAVEPADKMTDRQITAKVLKRFHVGRG